MTSDISAPMAAHHEPLVDPGAGRATRNVRAVACLMLAEAVSLAVSGGLHLSGVVTGRSAPFNGTHAGIAEAIIAVVLIAGAQYMLRSPERGRRVGIVLNAAAVVGFLNGLNMTARGGHLPDVVYHLTVLPLLVGSVLVLVRTRPCHDATTASSASAPSVQIGETGKSELPPFVGSSTRPPWPDTAAAGRYRLDPAASTITFRATHAFDLAPVVGALRVKAGYIDLHPDRRTASLTVCADAASLATGSRRRDRHLRSARFLDAAAYPELAYRADSIDQGEDGWAVAGELTARGVRQAVTLTITAIGPTERGFGARAHTRLDRYAFGLTAAQGMVARCVDVEVTAVADRL